jgi:hypothetical protein
VDVLVSLLDRGEFRWVLASAVGTAGKVTVHIVLRGGVLVHQLADTWGQTLISIGQMLLLLVIRSVIGGGKSLCDLTQIAWTPDCAN